MNKCCFEQLDNSRRIDRFTYQCPKCSSDVSLAYMFYLNAIVKDASIKQGVPMNKEKIKDTVKEELKDIITDEMLEEIKETVFTKLTRWLKKLLKIK